MRERVIAMSILGGAIQRLATKITQRRVVEETKVIMERHGDLDASTSSLKSFAAEVDRKAAAIEL